MQSTTRVTRVVSGLMDGLHGVDSVCSVCVGRSTRHFKFAINILYESPVQWSVKGGAFYWPPLPTTSPVKDSNWFAISAGTPTKAVVCEKGAYGHRRPYSPGHIGHFRQFTPGFRPRFLRHSLSQSLSTHVGSAHRKSLSGIPIGVSQVPFHDEHCLLYRRPAGSSQDSQAPGNVGN